MKGGWDKYQEMGIVEPLLKENRRIKQVNLSKGMNLYSKNNIDIKGCFYLSKFEWPNLQTILLGNQYRLYRWE